jgi:hypothetical protein
MNCCRVLLVCTVTVVFFVIGWWHFWRTHSRMVIVRRVPSTSTVQYVNIQESHSNYPQQAAFPPKDDLPACIQTCASVPGADYPPPVYNNM